MKKFKGMANGADPMEYAWPDRPTGVVSYATGRTCAQGHDCDKHGAFWESNPGTFCCCVCGHSLRFWGKDS